MIEGGMLKTRVKAVRRQASGDLTPYDSRLTIYGF